MNLTGTQAFVRDYYLNIYFITKYKKQKEFPNERLSNMFKSGNAEKHSLIDAGILLKIFHFIVKLMG